MATVKEIIEGARFLIAATTPFEAYMVKGADIRTCDHTAPFDLRFSIRDVLIDPVLQELRPAPETNIWKQRIPLDVVSYCYKMLPFRRTSFVWDVRGQMDGGYDYVVCVFRDADVQRSPDYDRLFAARAEALVRAGGSETVAD